MVILKICTISLYLQLPLFTCGCARASYIPTSHFLLLLKLKPSDSHPLAPLVNLALKWLHERLLMCACASMLAHFTLSSSLLKHCGFTSRPLLVASESCAEWLCVETLVLASSTLHTCRCSDRNLHVVCLTHWQSKNARACSVVALIPSSL